MLKMKKSIGLKVLGQLLVFVLIIFGLGTVATLLGMFLPRVLSLIMVLALILKLFGVVWLVKLGQFKRHWLFKVAFLGVLVAASSVFFYSVLSMNFELSTRYKMVYVNLCGHLLILLSYLLYLATKRDTRMFFNLKLLFIMLETTIAALGFQIYYNSITTEQVNWLQLISTTVILILIIRVYKRQKRFV